MNLKKTLFIISALVVGSVLFVLVTGDIGWENIFQSLSQVTIWQLLAVLAVLLMSMEISVLVWYLILKDQGEDPSYWLLHRVRIASFPVSYFTPFSTVGGEFLRIYLTDKESDMSLKNTVVSLAVERLINFTVSFSLMLIGVGVFFILGGRFTPIVNIALIPVFVILFFLFYLLFFGGKTREGILKKIFRWSGGEKMVKNGNGKAIVECEERVLSLFNFRNKKFWSWTSLTVLRNLLLFGEVALILYFLIPNGVTFINSLVAYSSTVLSTVLLIPANLGTLELIERFAFQALGLQLSLSVIFSLIWRSARLLLCVIGGIYFLSFAKKMIEEKVINFIEAVSSLWKTKK